MPAWRPSAAMFVFGAVRSCTSRKLSDAMRRMRTDGEPTLPSSAARLKRHADQEKVKCMTQRVAISERDVLLVVDVQNDFCPGGKLAVPNGSDVVPPINRLAARFAHVILTQDWHP